MSVEAPSDAAELAALGYQQELPRLLRFWSNFAIGFAFISPIVGMYTVAALEIQTVGAAWIWAVLVVAIGQLVVALVFAELGAKWPIAGGVYQWARRLLGPKWGWWTGWIYIWSMVATLSVIAYAGGGYLGELLGISSPSTATSIELALVVMAIYTFVNAIGLHLLRFIVNLGITAEIIATLFLGTLLVLFFRHHSPSILVTTRARSIRARPSRPRSPPWPTAGGFCSGSTPAAPSPRRPRTRRSECHAPPSGRWPSSG